VSGVDDLVQWLREQLDEDERIARRAGDSFRQIGETGVIVATEGDRAEECASANWAGVAEHIVTHDPARVLHEIAAKRAVVARYEFACREASRVDLTEDERETWIRVGGALQSVVIQLAAPYADRPGYRQEWAP
jgi:hypothetical protein